jgi:hypothetical protein
VAERSPVLGPGSALGSDNMVVFMAGIEDGLGLLLFHAAGSLGLRRIAVLGDPLPVSSRHLRLTRSRPQRQTAD